MKGIIMIAISLMVCVTMACNSQKAASTSTSTSSPREAGNEQGGKKGRPSVDEVFKMDTNGDGKLAKSEVKGRLLNDFSKFDADGDGFITKAEFQNAPKPEKGGGRPPRN